MNLFLPVALHFTIFRLNARSAFIYINVVKKRGGKKSFFALFFRKKARKPNGKSGKKAYINVKNGKISY